MSVFVKTPVKPEPGYNMAVLLNKKETKGRVGLEIEIEGKRLPHEDKTPHPWVYHQDGSLRGTDNGEYVLAKPIEFKEVEGALDTLWDTFKELKSVLDESNRTSVHVHLNVQDFHMNRLTSLMALYFTFEEVLTEWCGEHRVGNLFCLRGKDAPAILSQIRRFIQRDGEWQFSDGLHYSGLNPLALSKFGSLEFRPLRGCPDKDTILGWVGILQRLYDLSADFSDPREICSLFSSEGSTAFFDAILRDKAAIVRAGVSFDNDRISESMYEGIRLAQDLCYCRDWTLYKPVALNIDPFGRDPRKLIKRLAAQPAPNPAYILESLDEGFEPQYDDEAPLNAGWNSPPPLPVNMTFNTAPTWSTSPITVITGNN